MASADDPVEIEVPPIGPIREIELPSISDIAVSERPIDIRREMWRGWLALLLMALLSLLAVGLVAVAVSLVRPFNIEAIGLLIS
jgi:hypothetical protein